MADEIIQYNLLISCPGDATGVVDIIKEVVDGFNQQFSDILGIGIRCRYWKDSAYAESGGKPQELLNKQIVKPSDLAVAVFKNRFGSPTERYGSGTEEEIEEMLSAGKQVFVFFDESPVKPSDIDRGEYDKVQNFKKKYEDKGIYWSFNNNEEFKDVFRAHITRYFLKMSDDKANKKSNLIIKSYRNGEIQDNIHLSLFEMNDIVFSDKLKQQIIEQINKIRKTDLSESGGLSQPTALWETQVLIDENTKTYISKIVEAFGVYLGEDFFDVGNLKKSAFTPSLLYGAQKYEGTQKEKTKYDAIINLKRMIDIACSHCKLEELYKDLFGVKLILCNEGTIYDEDIDVEITIPKDRYVSVDDLSVPTEEIQLDGEQSFEEIFEIKDTKDFILYTDSKNPLTASGSNHISIPGPFSEKSYEEEYRDTLREIFEYKVYPDNKDVIIRVHFDFIKQHQNVAFPTWIFIKNTGEEISAKYRITSKNNSGVVERQIEIKVPECDNDS